MTDKATDTAQSEKTTGWRSRIPKLALLAAVAGGVYLYVRDPERWKSRLSQVRDRTTGDAQDLSRRIIPADDAETQSNPGSAPQSGAPMHARVGFYQVTPGTLDASLAKARAELLPKTREQPGLKRYTVITTGPDSFISLSGWDTRAQAEQAAETLSGWVKENMGATVVSMENRIGEVILERGQFSPDTLPRYGTVRVQTLKSGSPDLSGKVRVEFLPQMDRQPGFNSYVAIRTDDGKVITYGSYDSKEQAEKAAASLQPWADAHIAPHVEHVDRHAGAVAWTVRKG